MTDSKDSDKFYAKVMRKLEISLSCVSISDANDD